MDRNIDAVLKRAFVYCYCAVQARPSNCGEVKEQFEGVGGIWGSK